MILFSIMMKKWLFLKNIPTLRIDYKNHTLFMEKSAKIDTLFMTKTKTIPYGAAHTCIAHIREYPSPRGLNVGKLFFGTAIENLTDNIEEKIHCCKIRLRLNVFGKEVNRKLKICQFIGHFSNAV